MPEIMRSLDDISNAKPTNAPLPTSVPEESQSTPKIISRESGSSWTDQNPPKYYEVVDVIQRVKNTFTNLEHLVGNPEDYKIVPMNMENNNTARGRRNQLADHLDTNTGNGVTAEASGSQALDGNAMPSKPEYPCLFYLQVLNSSICQYNGPIALKFTHDFTIFVKEILPPSLNDPNVDLGEATAVEEQDPIQALVALSMRNGNTDEATNSTDNTRSRGTNLFDKVNPFHKPKSSNPQPATPHTQAQAQAQTQAPAVQTSHNHCQCSPPKPRKYHNLLCIITLTTYDGSTIKFPALTLSRITTAKLDDQEDGELTPYVVFLDLQGRVFALRSKSIDTEEPEKEFDVWGRAVEDGNEFEDDYDEEKYHPKFKVNMLEEMKDVIALVLGRTVEEVFSKEPGGVGKIEGDIRPVKSLGFNLDLVTAWESEWVKGKRVRGGSYWDNEPVDVLIAKVDLETFCSFLRSIFFTSPESDLALLRLLWLDFRVKLRCPSQNSNMKFLM
ncbi:hypothetical protein G7Y89_g5444 [Cudoniella acicularis]|uniref:Uncharacterized protein n=1 Tax=Cudoniella acicularis TaxID=354080 RepID=A0A8H4W5Q3_9HELO|nr:hypothetical protein G7Y89_g5444 [Cudoniella acicularis]